MTGSGPARQRRTVFGEVAELYDRRRPSYPDALVDAVLEYAGPHELRILDVGAGTGKATVLFAARGAEVVALEPDPAMAALARRNAAAIARISVEQAEFELWSPPPDGFDLLIAAQAWHWLDPETRCARAHRALRAGGAIALFWNRPLWESCPLRPALDDAYRNLAGSLDEDGVCVPSPRSSPVVDEAGAELAASGLFGSVEQRRFPWSETYTTDGYLALLRTHSDHRMLPPEQLKSLLQAVGEIVDEGGGAITLDHETQLSLAHALG